MGRETGPDEFEGVLQPDQLTAALMAGLMELVLALPTEARAALTAFVHLADQKDQIVASFEIGETGELCLTLRHPRR